MNAPGLFARLRGLRRSCSLLLPLPGVLCGAFRTIQQLAMLDLSKDVVCEAKCGLVNLCDHVPWIYKLGNVNHEVILLIQLCRSRYRDLLWNLLTYANHNFAWKVRQEVVLFVHDLVAFGETKLASALHVVAFECYRRLSGWKRRELVDMYKILREEADAEFRFKMMQFNAALVAGDIQWIVGKVPGNRVNTRMFSYYRVPSTPMAHPEID